MAAGQAGPLGVGHKEMDPNKSLAITAIGSGKAKDAARALLDLAAFGVAYLVMVVQLLTFDKQVDRIAKAIPGEYRVRKPFKMIQSHPNGFNNRVAEAEMTESEWNWQLARFAEEMESLNANHGLSLGTNCILASNAGGHTTLSKEAPRLYVEHLPKTRHLFFFTIPGDDTALAPNLRHYPDYPDCVGLPTILTDNACGRVRVDRYLAVLLRNLLIGPRTTKSGQPTLSEQFARLEGISSVYIPSYAEVAVPVVHLPWYQELGRRYRGVMPAVLVQQLPDKLADLIVSVLQREAMLARDVPAIDPAVPVFLGIGGMPGPGELERGWPEGPAQFEEQVMDLARKKLGAKNQQLPENLSITWSNTGHSDDPKFVRFPAVLMTPIPDHTPRYFVNKFLDRCKYV